MKNKEIKNINFKKKKEKTVFHFTSFTNKEINLRTLKIRIFPSKKQKSQIHKIFQILTNYYNIILEKIKKYQKLPAKKILKEVRQFGKEFKNLKN